MRIVIGEGSCGIAAGALKIHSALEKLLSGKDDIKIGSAGCIGMCFLEPIVDVYDGEKLFKRFVKVLEKDAVNTSMLDLFNCATNSSIQNVSICVIRLFLYLDVKTLDLREIGKLFCQKRCKYKIL